MRIPAANCETDILSAQAKVGGQVRRVILILAGLSVVLPARAQECGSCHPREAREHAASAHAHSLQPALQSAFYGSLPARPIGEARGGYLFWYQQDGPALRLTTQRENDAATGSIEWVFGAGRQAETPVVRQGSQYREHRLSYYVADQRIDLTMGHARGVSSSAETAIGRSLSPDEAARCFGCHSSGGTAGDALVPGVQCERCHSGAAQHARNGGGPIGNPGHLTPIELVRFCSGCHRSQAEGDPDDSINVRYQAVGLQRSKCFRSGKLSCITCHDPHANVRQDAAWYRSQCLACHADQAKNGDCLECHMSRVSPVPHLTFTDHYIRVKTPARK